MESVYIIDDPRNELATNSREEFERRLTRVGIRIERARPEASPLLIARGGDGWMLRVIQEYWRKRKPIFGINFGHVGYLMNDQRDNLETLLAQRRYKSFSFPFLEYEIRLESGVKKGLAVNDVYTDRLTGQSSRYQLFINGERFGEEIMGDGVIVSTALGSTAYAFAAGGNPLHPRLRGLAIVPKATHAPRQIEPIVVPSNFVIEIEFLEPEKRRVKVTGDGSEFDDVRHVVIRQSRKSFQLAFLESENFTHRLFEKLLKVR